MSQATASHEAYGTLVPPSTTLTTTHWLLVPDARSPLERTLDQLVAAAEALAAACHDHARALHEPPA